MIHDKILFNTRIWNFYIIFDEKNVVLRRGGTHPILTVRIHMPNGQQQFKASRTWYGFTNRKLSDVIDIHQHSDSLRINLPKPKQIVKNFNTANDYTHFFIVNIIVLWTFKNCWALLTFGFEINPPSLFYWLKLKYIKTLVMNFWNNYLWSYTIIIIYTVIDTIQIKSYNRIYHYSI